MPSAKRSSRGRDRKLVAGGQRHEVSYTSRKAGHPKPKSSFPDPLGQLGCLSRGMSEGLHPSTDGLLRAWA
jgi:hypothetical protein